MKQQKKRFVLAEATVDEIDRQLKVNMFVIALLVVMIVLNAVHFMKNYSLFYGGLIAIMAFFLFVMAKSRTLLHLRKQALTQ